jgi:hypothetical protein
MIRILPCLLFSLTAFAADPAPAEKPPENVAPKDRSNIVLDFTFTSVPRDAALKLRKAFQQEPAKAAQELERLVADGKAEILAAPLLRTVSGERTMSEDIEEEPYAIEYQSPLVVDKVPAELPKEAPLTMEIGGIAATLQTRPVGFMVEAEPVWNAAMGEIEMRWRASHIVLAGQRRITVEKQPGNVKVSVEQPLFRNNTADSTDRLKPGVPTLLAVFRLPGDAERFEFVTVTAHREEKK